MAVRSVSGPTSPGAAAAAAKETRVKARGGSATVSSPSPLATNAIRSAPTASELKLPERLSRYQVRARVGTGAFGTVFWAYDPKYDGDVALKELRSAPAGRREEAEGFHREARIAARLRHPNVVAFYESGEHDGQYYLAVQLVCGESLEERLRREPRLPAREAAELIRKIAREENLTVLFVEHDMEVVFGIADYITVLHYGAVLAEGTPTQIRANPDVQRAYLGEITEEEVAG